MKSLEERMVSGDPVEMLQAQREFLDNIRKSQEEALEKIKEVERTLTTLHEKMIQKKS